MRFETSVQLLALARRLAGTAEGLTLDEMAQDVGVSRRTAERLRDALRDLYPTFDEVRDGQTKRFVIRKGLSSFEQTPSADELAELQNAIRALDETANFARGALLRSLERKVRAALHAPQRRKIEPDLDALLAAEGLVMQAGPKPRIDADTLALLRQALKGCQLCEFHYAASGDAKPRRRIVRPFGLLYGRLGYLVGATGRADQPVLWRLDRISSLRLAGPAKPLPAAFDLAAFAATSFGAFQEPPVDISLKFSADAAPDAANFLFHPTQKVQPRSDGSLMVNFRSGGLLELVHHLFTWGGDVEILEPPALKHMMIAELGVAFAKHGATPK